MTATILERARAALRGRYEIERELGRGGMATVFLAHDVKHDRPVAVKVLRPELAAVLGPERFLREVRITARLSHPHILPLLDSGESDGLLYYIMPFVEGESLRSRLERGGAMPLAEALSLARDVADALSHAHSRGIVHRDVKPENILLESGHAVVADFGVARAADQAAADGLTATGLAIGTPLYMSPEQAQGQRALDGRSDVYALGCVLYEMLAGEPPFGGPTAQAITARKLTEPVSPLRPRRGTVPPAVDAALARALAPLPADRFQTAAEFGAALQASDRTTDAPEVPGPRRFIPRLVAAFLVVAAALAAWHAFPRGATDATPEAAASIAVLPFVNVSAGPEHEYFADGLTEELIATLARVGGLRVASRTSAFAFKGKELDVRDIGRQLGVDAVLEGSVRRSDRRLRVTARLVAVGDGYQRWSDSYDREIDDALAIQEELSAAIVAELKGRLGVGDRAAVRRAAIDPTAYDLYLKGRYFWHQRSEQGLRGALAQFREAVTRAPRFAQAHLGLADTYAVLGFYDYLPPREAFPPAARAATDALALDPRLGAAHATLGYVALYHDWDWTRAAREFERAIALDPEYSTAHQWYGNYLTAMGRFAEAERAMRRAQELDPLSIIATAALGWALYYAGEYDRAVAQCRRALELNQSFALAHLWAGQALIALGRTDEALAHLRQAVDLSGEGSIFVASLAQAHAARGDRREAQQLLARLESRPVAPSYEIATVYAELGRRGDALAWLERAFEERSHSIAFLRVDPRLGTLRDEPRFRALLARMRLSSTAAPG